MWWGGGGGGGGGGGVLPGPGGQVWGWFLPDDGRGTHEHIIEQKEAALLGLDDLTAVVVDRLHHVVRANQVAAAVAQKLRAEKWDKD